MNFGSHASLFKECFVKSYACIAFAMVSVISGCKTVGSNSSVKDTAATTASGELHCSFVLPNGTGDMFEIWATPSDQSKLTGVKDRFTIGKQGPGAINNRGTITAIDASDLTKTGYTGTRAY